MSWKIAPIGRGDDLLYSQAGTPSLDLRFAGNKNLNDFVTNTPLVDHQRSMSGSNLNPGTFVNSSGLIESAKVNLLPYSQEFNPTTWTSLLTTWSSNVRSAPDTTLTVDKPDKTWILWGIYDQSNSAWIIGPQNYPFTITTEWVRQDLQFTAPAGCTVARFYPGRVNNSIYFYQVATVVPGQTYTASAYFKLDTDNTVLIWGAQLEEGSTATTYIPTTNAPSAAPRFDHDPTTGESLGLLVEESRTNLHTHSEDLTQNYIAANLVNGTASATNVTETDPSGSLNSVSKITLTRTAITDAANWRTYIATSGSVVFSVYVKAATSSDIGKVISIKNEGNGTGPITSVGVTLTDSWQRVVTPVFAGSTVSRPWFGIYQSTDSTGTVEFLAWGAQLEAGSFPTSYIPTSGATATRAADAVSITGSNFSNWFNDSEGTILFDSTRNGVDAYLNKFTFCAPGGSVVDRIYLKSSNTISNFIGNGFNINAGLLTDNTRKKFAGSYSLSQNSSRACANGTITDIGGYTSASSAVDRLYLFANRLGTGIVSGHISRLTYWPHRLPDATLQTITT